jgi:hypothetical protein
MPFGYQAADDVTTPCRALDWRAFAIVSFTTHWDWWRGDDMVEKVAERFDLSYSDDAARPVQQGDPEWPPLLRLIEQYSPDRGELPKDRPPVMFARDQAIASVKTTNGDWTAPTTPIVLLYRKSPEPGSQGFKPGQDAFVIGTIGELHDWVRRDRADFDFFWRTIIFGLLSACVGVALALADTPAPPDANQPARCRYQGRH